MTDNEIIKALEICVDEEDRCGECPYCQYRFDLVIPCAEKNGKDLLNLINRQKAEIERLQNKVEELAEVLSNSIRIRYAEAKAEAINELAVRFENELTEKVEEFYFVEEYEFFMSTNKVLEFFDNLVKEMVGEG